MALVFAAIAPHGSMAIAERCKPEERALAAKMREAMEEPGRRFAVASPDVTVLLTPPNIHVERGMAVVLAGSMAGTLESGAMPISMRVPSEPRCSRSCGIFQIRIGLGGLVVSNVGAGLISGQLPLGGGGDRVATLASKPRLTARREQADAAANSLMQQAT